MSLDCRCLILAAGKGTRLLPLTKRVPKPLFPLLNTPALDRLIRKLRKEGLYEITINCHHLAGEIERWKVNSSLGAKVSLLRERILLDTGGAVKNLINHLGYDTPLIVHNADIVSNLPVKKLYALFRQQDIDTLAMFCLHDRPPFNKVKLKGENIISFNGDGDDLLAYTGIAIFSPRCFIDAPSGPFPLIPYVQQLIHEGGKIRGCRAEDLVNEGKNEWIWHDYGSPEGYLCANFSLLARNGKSRFMEKHSAIGPEVTTGKNVIIGKDAVVSGSLKMENVVIWPETVLHMNGEVKNAIFSPFGHIISC